ncbi:MAG TPA: IS1595 family transposase [Gaiellaceae bacterium]|jgi:transposase-like protein|nr:IS1595 family transposase [Gaiellaceae bacterium]
MSPDVLIFDPERPIAGWRELVAVDEPGLRNDWSRAYLERLRWPDGVRCPRCRSRLSTRVATRHQFDCRTCRYRFSVTSGTYLHDSAVPLWKWLVAVSLLVESEEGFPAHRLSATIGVSYKTAWSLEHRIRAAMDADNDGAAPNGSSGPARSYHQVSPRYLEAYAAERTWRELHGSSPDAFADGLRALLHPRSETP